MYLAAPKNVTITHRYIITLAFHIHTLFGLGAFGILTIRIFIDLSCNKFVCLFGCAQTRSRTILNLFK